MSFFIIRLLQNFDKITIDMDAQPQRRSSLLEWKTERREVERDLLAVHLGLSTKVSFGSYVCRFAFDTFVIGWRVGEDERGTKPRVKQGPGLRGVGICLFSACI